MIEAGSFYDGSRITLRAMPTGVSCRTSPWAGTYEYNWVIFPGRGEKLIAISSSFVWWRR